MLPATEAEAALCSFWRNLGGEAPPWLGAYDVLRPVENAPLKSSCEAIVRAHTANYKRV
jgi:hypothetical protein